MAQPRLTQAVHDLRSAAPATRAGYGYIELPVFEETGLFVRGVGETRQDLETHAVDQP